jgi:hypothetical protein
MLKLNDYPNPDGLRLIIYITLFSYLYGTLALKHSRHRRHFFNSVILYSYFFYLYGRYYFLANPKLIKLTYVLYLLRAAVHNTNKFSFEFDTLLVTLQSGLGDIVADNLIKYMKEIYEQELLTELNKQILIFRRK